MCWTHNLMGFRSLPYNSIWMYLIAEEAIRGDRHDLANAFQWNTIMLNLPSTKGYKSYLAWISKCKADGSLASNFVCFVDDLRITGQRRLRMIEAGHAISTRESWLGIQDALQKLRCQDGRRGPGACLWITKNVSLKIKFYGVLDRSTLTHFIWTCIFNFFT